MTDNRSAITVVINTNLADNTTGAITPALLRAALLEMLNNMPTLADAETFNTGAKTFGVAPIMSGLSGLLFGGGVAAISGPIPNANPASLTFQALTVNLNSAADTQIPIQLPPGCTRYKVNALHVSNASTSLTTAQIGLYTAAAQGGVNIVAQTTTGITNNTDATNLNSYSATIIDAGTRAYNDTPLYFNVGTPQGGAATADVTLSITPLP